MEVGTVDAVSLLLSDSSPIYHRVTLSSHSCLTSGEGLRVVRRMLAVSLLGLVCPLPVSDEKLLECLDGELKGASMPTTNGLRDGSPSLESPGDVPPSSALHLLLATSAHADTAATCLPVAVRVLLRADHKTAELASSIFSAASSSRVPAETIQEMISIVCSSSQFPPSLGAHDVLMLLSSLSAIEHPETANVYVPVFTNPSISVATRSATLVNLIKDDPSFFGCLYESFVKSIPDNVTAADAYAVMSDVLSIPPQSSFSICTLLKKLSSSSSLSPEQFSSLISTSISSAAYTQQSATVPSLCMILSSCPTAEGGVFLAWAAHHYKSDDCNSNGHGGPVIEFLALHFPRTINNQQPNTSIPAALARYLESTTHREFLLVALSRVPVRSHLRILSDMLPHNPISSPYTSFHRHCLDFRADLLEMVLPHPDLVQALLQEDDLVFPPLVPYFSTPRAMCTLEPLLSHDEPRAAILTTARKMLAANVHIETAITYLEALLGSSDDDHPSEAAAHHLSNLIVDHKSLPLSTRAKLISRSTLSDAISKLLMSYCVKSDGRFHLDPSVADDIILPAAFRMTTKDLTDAVLAGVVGREITGDGCAEAVVRFIFQSSGDDVEQSHAPPQGSRFGKTPPTRNLPRSVIRDALIHELVSVHKPSAETLEWIVSLTPVGPKSLSSGAFADLAKAVERDPRHARYLASRMPEEGAREVVEDLYKRTASEVVLRARVSAFRTRLEEALSVSSGNKKVQKESDKKWDEFILNVRDYRKAIAGLIGSDGINLAEDLKMALSSDSGGITADVFKVYLSSSRGDEVLNILREYELPPTLARDTAKVLVSAGRAATLMSDCVKLLSHWYERGAEDWVQLDGCVKLKDAEVWSAVISETLKPIVGTDLKPLLMLLGRIGGGVGPVAASLLAQKNKMRLCVTVEKCLTKMRNSPCLDLAKLLHACKVWSTIERSRVGGSGGNSGPEVALRVATTVTKCEAVEASVDRKLKAVLSKRAKIARSKGREEKKAKRVVGSGNAGEGGILESAKDEGEEEAKMLTEFLRICSAKVEGGADLPDSSGPTRRTREDNENDDDENDGALYGRKKAKRATVRSRNRTVDKWLGEEEVGVGDDAYEDLEGFIA